MADGYQARQLTAVIEHRAVAREIITE